MLDKEEIIPRDCPVIKDLAPTTPLICASNQPTRNRNHGVVTDETHDFVVGGNLRGVAVPPDENGWTVAGGLLGAK